MMEKPFSKRPLRVCFFGTYRANYVRNQVVIEGLRRNGVEVETCHSTLWHSVADRVSQAGGGWKNPRFWWRVAGAYGRLWRRHRQTAPYDVLLVRYPGQFDVYLGRMLSWWRRKPMALDILMSLHLIAVERGLTVKSPITGRIIFSLEKYGLKLPDRLIADTREYETYYRQKYDLAEQNFSLVPLGVDDRLYTPRPHIHPPAEPIRIIYYGTFIPLHGLETVIRAAARLQDTHPHIQFLFYGDGQERPMIESLADQLNVTNVDFKGWIDKVELPNEIARAHICLGVFGNTKQSRCTIQNKIWEGMMMQRPVITGDAETIRAELNHGEHLYLVERGSPQALAEGLIDLASNSELRERIATAAYERVQANTITATGGTIKQALLDTLPPVQREKIA